MREGRSFQGIYLVSEPATLIKGSGAYRHIEVGRKYLGKHFNLVFYPACNLPVSKSGKQVSIDRSSVPSKFKTLLKRLGLWHTIKDLKVLFDNHRSIYKHYKAIKKLSPDFIYERSSFLNFQGLIISKWLGIPHFYENNGIKYLEHQERVKTWLGWLWKYLEKRAYQKSDFVFFVGLWGDRINLSTKNWMNIENGIEQSFIDHFRGHKKEITDKINICFVGSLMQHHGFSMLIKALKDMDTSSLHLHLIGSKLDTVATEISPIIETTYHGFLDRADLAGLLEKMHVGIIPGGKEYPSFMKLFDYGAAKCLVIAPDLKNLRFWFSEDEIAFFEKGNVASLRNRMLWVLKNKDLIEEKGNKIYRKISASFVWDEIYGRKAAVIRRTIDAYEKAK